MALRLMDFVSEDKVEQEKELFRGGPRVADKAGINEKPLFEILKENKDKKDAEFNEKFRHRPPKALDDDETEFLESVEMRKRELERQRIEEETEQLINFQAALASRTIPVEAPRSLSHEQQERQEAAMRNKKHSQSRALPIAVKIMPLPKRSKLELPVKDVQLKEAEEPRNLVDTRVDGNREQKPADMSHGGLLGLVAYGGESDEEDE